MQDQSMHNVVSMRKSRYKVPIILCVCLIVCLLIGVWFLLSRVYVVEHIACRMDREECSESVMAELERLHKAAFFLDHLR